MCNCCEETFTFTTAGTDYSETTFNFLPQPRTGLEQLRGGLLLPRPKMAVFKGTETFVVWSDGSTTSANWMGGEDESYDPEDAVALCIAYKIFGTKSAFRKFVSDGKFQMTKEEKQEVKADKKRRKLISEVSDALKGNEDNKVDQSTEDEFPF